MSDKYKRSDIEAVKKFIEAFEGFCGAMELSEKCKLWMEGYIDGMTLGVQPVESNSGWVSVPDDQCEWWWYNQDPDGAPILVSVLYSFSSGEHFASVGQHGWNVAQDVKDMGGVWMKAQIPEPPKDKE